MHANPVANVVNFPNSVASIVNRANPIASTANFIDSNVNVAQI